MKVRTTLAVIRGMGVAFAVMCGATSQAATSIPYAESFETGFTISDPWTTNGSGTAASSVAAVLTGAGARGLLLSNDTATLDINNATYSNTWIQVYARPVTGSADPSVSGVNGAFYLTSGGALRAYTGAWTTVATGLPTGQYLGFIVHADYPNDTWDLYYASGQYKTNMTLANSSPLHFAGAATHIDNVSVESGDTTYVDAVAVSRAFTDAGATGDKVQAYEHTATATALQEFTIPVYASAYTNPASAKTLAGRLGNDILSGLVNGDEVYVWTTNDAFAVYTVSGNAFVAFPQSPSAPATTDMQVFSNTRLQLDQNNSRSQTFGFYGYNNATVITLLGQVQPSAAGATEQCVLNGTSGGRTGYTALTWPGADTFATIEIKDPDADLTQGDRLFVASPSNPNAFAEYWWNNTANAWYRFNGQPAAGAIQAGSKLWVRRQGASDEPVTITH